MLQNPAAQYVGIYPISTNHNQIIITDFASQALKKKLRAAAYTEKGMDCRALFAEVDKDGGGELDFDEFCAAIRKKGKLSSYTTSEQQLREVFQACDLDRGGTIDVDEFADFLIRKPGEPAPGSIVIIPEIVDQNVHSAFLAAQESQAAYQEANVAKNVSEKKKVAAEQEYDQANTALKTAKQGMEVAIATAQKQVEDAGKGDKEQAEQALTETKEFQENIVAEARTRAEACKQEMRTAQDSFATNATMVREAEIKSKELAQHHASLLSVALESRYEEVPSGSL